MTERSAAPSRLADRVARVRARVARVRALPAPRSRSARTRIVAWFLFTLLLASAASVLVVRQVLLLRLNDQIEADLTQEVEEFRSLAAGSDPLTAQPFGTDAQRVIRVFLERNFPDRTETFLGFADGQVFPAVGTRAEELRADVDLLQDFQSISEPRRGKRETALGTVEYLALPLQDADGEVLGVFAVFEFRDPQVAAINDLTRLQIGVGLAVLGVAAAVMWAVAERILAPVRALTATARAISESDLDRRIEVEGDDELAQLARTFNAMLDRLETAFHSQRAFIDDAGHELRTPITIIRGHLELMGDDPRDREETLAVVEDELRRMSRFVDDLLLLAKAQRPDFLTLETVDVEQLTAELAQKVRGLGDRDWQVEAEGRGLIVGDRQRLTQAMMQLAANATQHTEPGALIALGSQVAEGWARFWVRDTGTGVPLHEQQRIFDRFARSAGGARRSEGAGLGLSIVSAIAAAHHGRVELRSRPGAGATFTLVVPVDHPGPDDRSPHPNHSPHPTHSQPIYQESWT